MALSRDGDGGWALSVSARPAMGTVMQMLDGQRMLDERGLDYFRTASVFGRLPTKAIRFLLTCGRVLAVADGEELFHLVNRVTDFSSSSRASSTTCWGARRLTGRDPYHRHGRTVGAMSR